MKYLSDNFLKFFFPLILENRKFIRQNKDNKYITTRLILALILKANNKKLFD